jgi:putative transposase
MQLTAKVLLKTTPEQSDALKRTMQMANAACDWLSGLAFEGHVFNRFALQKSAYHKCRENFAALSSQMTIHCCRKVADAYKIDKKVKRTFKQHGAIPYDARILSLKIDKSVASIWSVDGRLSVPFACGERQRELLKGKWGESDVCLIGGKFFLFIACSIEEAKPIDVADFLGVDMGIVNVATDSDGEQHSGKKVEDERRKFAHRRRNLQRKGTRSAKRKLRKLSGRQQRFQKHTNHVISKQIVRKAQDTQRGIAIEELGGIRERATVRRKQRARLANWAFSDLRLKMTYKAKLAGVPLIAVDPRNTSRTCPQCGCIDKANRRSQSDFRCVHCGFAAHADINAARNIRARAAVNRPLESRASCLSNHVASGGFQPQIQSHLL